MFPAASCAIGAFKINLNPLSEKNWHRGSGGYHSLVKRFPPRDPLCLLILSFEVYRRPTRSITHKCHLHFGDG